VANAGNTKLLSVEPDQLHKKYYICEDHFADDQRSAKHRKYLKRSGIPTRFTEQSIDGEDLHKFNQLLETINKKSSKDSVKSTSIQVVELQDKN